MFGLHDNDVLCRQLLLTRAQDCTIRADNGRCYIICRPGTIVCDSCHAQRASGYGEPEHPPFKCPLPETPALGAWGTPSLLALEVRGLLQGSSHGTGPTLCPQHLLILLGRLVIGARDDFSRPSERGQGRCGASVSRAFKTQLAAVNR
jgi:hypothetical protein